MRKALAAILLGFFVTVQAGGKISVYKTPKTFLSSGAAVAATTLAASATAKTPWYHSKAICRPE